MHINDEMKEIQGQEEIIENEIEYIKSINPKKKFNSISGKKERIFICIIIGILFILSICSYVYLPQLFNSVSYDIEAEQIIHNGDKCIQLEKYEEGIEKYSSVQKSSRFFYSAQEKIQNAKNEYENATLLLMRDLLDQNQVVEAYDMVKDVENYLGETSQLKDGEKLIIDVMKERIVPEISIDYSGNELVEGDEIDLSTLHMNLNYADRYEEEMVPDSCRPIIVEKSGENILILTYSSGKHSYEWRVDALPKIIGIEAKYTGKELTRGDTINKKDFEIVGICTDESSRKINVFDIDPLVVENYGENVFNIYYQGLNCLCKIDALPQLSQIEVKTREPYYVIDSVIREEDIMVFAQYENGTRRELGAEDYTIEDIITKKSGQNQLSVTYMGKIGETTVTVYSKKSLLQAQTLADSGYIYVDKEYNYYCGSLVEDTKYTDNYGNTYEYGINYRYPNFSLEDSYIEYNIKECTFLCGIFILNNVEKSTEEAGYFEFYGDNQLIYTSPNVARGFEPLPISIDVGEYDTIRIEIHGNRGAVSLVEPYFLSL